MNPIPNEMIDFLLNNHIVSLATYSNQNLWAASCFYVFDKDAQCILVMSAKKTRHAQQMLENPNVAGTIAVQTEHFNDIAGLQFQAVAKCLENGDERKRALELYCQKHPIAKLTQFANVEIWGLYFTKLKYTENKLVFAHKTEWEAIR